MDIVYDPVAEDHQALGRFCGPAHDTDQGLAYHILNNNRIMVTRSTINLLSQDNLKDPEVIDRMKVYSIKVDNAMGN